MAFERLSEIVSRVFKTDVSGNRIVIEGANVDGSSGGKFRLYTGDPNEVDETRIYAVTVGTGDAQQIITVIQNGRIGGPVTDVRNNVYFYSGSHDGGITFPPSVDIPYAQVIQALAASLRVKNATISNSATVNGATTLNGILHAVGAVDFDSNLNVDGALNAFLDSSFQANLDVFGLLDAVTARVGDPTNGIIHGIDFGFMSGGTTDAAGQITNTHHMGIAPVVAFCQIAGTGTNFKSQLVARTATDMTFKFVNSSTNALPAIGSAINYYWLAIS